MEPLTSPIPIKPTMRLALCASERDATALKSAGVRSIRVLKSVEDLYRFNGQAYELDATLAHFSEFVLAFPRGSETLRDDVAMRLGDVKCKWINWPDQINCAFDLADDTESTLWNLVESARRMWTDIVCTLHDIPDPEPEKTYKTGFPLLDRHGLRLVRPAFMPIIGPYGSGKSVLLRQLSVNLWKLHGWRTAITSFEERVKPRYQRDLRRHLIGHGGPYTDDEIVQADDEINHAYRFIRRPRGQLLDADGLINAVEYAAKVYGVEVVVIDPVNEIDHQVQRGESKTDYMGRFIMRLKQLADDYSLLIIACAHPPKDGVEKRLQKNGLLTLNDGADTAHYGNKADIGWCVWRNLDGPTMLHVDKLKDHESMGHPTLVELRLDPRLNAFREERIGYEILQDNSHE